MTEPTLPRHEAPVRRRAWRLLRWSLVGVAAALAAVAVAGAVARARLLGRTPPPGQLIDVGGYRLHLHCVGTGEPTVILEAGLLDFSVVWSRVQPASGALTRTCAYDRAGSGWSDPSPRARTSHAMVEELHTLLSRGQVQGPVILVGHSFGAIIARLYAHRFPDQVLGLVLVDGAHEDQWERLPAMQRAGEALVGQFRLLDRLGRSGLLALLPVGMPNRGLPPDAAAQYHNLLVASGYFGTGVRELEGLPRSMAQLRRAARRGPLQAPVVVISRGLPAGLRGLNPAGQAGVERVWRELQDNLAAGAPDREQVIAEQSGHDVHLQQPELVLDAIRRTVARSRRVGWNTRELAVPVPPGHPASEARIWPSGP